MTPGGLGRVLVPLAGVALSLALLLPEPHPDRLVARGLTALLLKDATSATQTERPSGATLFAAINHLSDARGTYRLAFEVERAEGTDGPDARELLGAFGPALNLYNAHRSENDRPPLSLVPPGEPGALPVRLAIERDGNRLSFRATVGGAPPLGVRSAQPWVVPGRGALLPPLLAIVIALVARRTVSALFVGIWVGAIVAATHGGRSWLGAVLPGLVDVFRIYLAREVVDSFRIEILGFVVALIAMVGVMTRCGGMLGIIEILQRYARTVRSTLGVTFGMGLLIFFDDYANCLLVGNTMRPLTDRLRVSREKLAYLVDSTAAPLAGISLLSTWIAFEVSTFASQLPAAGIPDNPYAVFVYTIPFRFYSIFTLVFVALVVFMGRDFGPMRTAEQRARTTGALVRPGGRPAVSEGLTRLGPSDAVRPDWRNGVIPIVVTLVVTLLEIFRSGGGVALLLDRPADLGRLESITHILLEGSGAGPLFVGALAGLAVAAGLALLARLPLREIGTAAASSTRSLGFAVVILFEAWMIGRVCQDLNTADYLIALFSGWMVPTLFPVLLFGIACLTAFATGSSWSTMAILLPNVVGLGAALGAEHPLGPLGMVTVSIGAVLEGAIFGDHCSPISDTTILSSVSCASDHIDHVRTQAPYALATASVAALLGYVPTLLFEWWSFPIAFVCGVGVLALGLRLFGRPSG